MSHVFLGLFFDVNDISLDELLHSLETRLHCMQFHLILRSWDHFFVGHEEGLFCDFRETILAANIARLSRLRLPYHVLEIFLSEDIKRLWRSLEEITYLELAAQTPLQFFRAKRFHHDSVPLFPLVFGDFEETFCGNSVFLAHHGFLLVDRFIGTVVKSR